MNSEVECEAVHLCDHPTVRLSYVCVSVCVRVFLWTDRGIISVYIYRDHLNQPLIC